MSLKAIRSVVALLAAGRGRRGRPKRIELDGGLVLHTLETRRGGMGVVHLCALEEGDEEPTVALKTFDESFFFDPTMQAAVEAEASCWLQVSGAPFVLPLIDVLTGDGKPYLMMPAIRRKDGGDPSLAGEIARAGRGMPGQRCLTLAIQIAAAITACDRLAPGIVHGDLKPGNVLILPDGTAQVADFGAARLSSLAGGSNRAQGTALYLAPECWNDSEAASASSDVYSFGATLFEMLTGRPPFEVDDGDVETLAQMHREVEVDCEVDDRDELGRALRPLLLRCMAKRPSDRPADMAAVSALLRSIGDKHEPILVLSSLATGMAAREMFADERLTTMRLRSILERGDGEACLQVLSRIPDEKIVGELLRLRGTALCLAGREEEALVDLGTFLADEPEGDERTRGANEMALALKRLGRLDEARELYEATIPQASPDMQLMLRANLASTLMAQGHADRAANVLRDLARRHPGSAEAWAMLSDSLSRTDAVDEAVAAIQMAVKLAPRRGSYRVMLGALLMDRFRDVGGALEALDAAYGLNYQSRDWLVRTLACNMLLDRKNHVLELIAHMRTGIDEQEGEAVLREAFAMASSVAGVDPEEADTGDASPAEPASARTVDRVDSQCVAQEGTPPAEMCEGLSEKEEAEQRRAAIRAGVVGHVQVRQSMVDGSRLFDFYYGFARPDYPRMFARAVTELEVKAMGLMAGNARARPFAFARCPDCAVDMLTQRDEGERYGCQGCEKRVPVTLVHDPELAGLMAAAMEAAGIVVRQTGAGTLFLAIMYPPEQSLLKVSSIMKLEGYEEVADSAMVSRTMLMQASERGMPASTRMSVWKRPLGAGLSIATDGTPTEVEALVRRLRRAAGMLFTMSMVVPADRLDEMLEDEAQTFGRMIDEGSTDDSGEARSLIETALRLGRLEDARRLLASLRLASPDDPDTFVAAAAVEMADGRLEPAIDLLEEALRQRPRDQGARMRLAQACLDAGRTERFHEVRDQLRAEGMLGGLGPSPARDDG